MADFASLTRVTFKKVWFTVYYFYFIEVPTPQHLCDSPKRFISQTHKSIHRQTHQGYLLLVSALGFLPFLSNSSYFLNVSLWHVFFDLVCCMSLLYNLIRFFTSPFLDNSAAVMQDPNKCLHSRFKQLRIPMCSAVSRAQFCHKLLLFNELLAD